MSNWVKKLPIRTKIIGVVGILVVAAAAGLGIYYAVKNAASADVPSSATATSKTINICVNNYAYDSAYAGLMQSVGLPTKHSNQLMSIPISGADSSVTDPSAIINKYRTEIYNAISGANSGTGAKFVETEDQFLQMMSSCTSSKPTKDSACVKEITQTVIKSALKPACTAGGDSQAYNPALKVPSVIQIGTASSAASGAKCVLMGPGKSPIWVIKRSDGNWCDAKTCTIKYTDKNGLPADSVLASSDDACGTLSANIQPAGGSPQEEILSAPGIGSQTGQIAPLGTSSITFRATRYSYAAGEAQQWMTPVGGVRFSLKTKVPKSIYSGKLNASDIAFAQSTSNGLPNDSSEGGSTQGGLPTDITAGGSTQSGLPNGVTPPYNQQAIQTYNGVYSSTAQAFASGGNFFSGLGSYFSSLRPLTVEGKIPDNGTKSYIKIVNLPAGTYELSLYKDGYKSANAKGIQVNGDVNLGDLPVIPTSGSEPPSINLYDIRVDPLYPNLYRAYSGAQNSYIYKSNCPDLGWMDPQNQDLCPKVQYSGGIPAFIDLTGDSIPGNDIATLARQYQEMCMGPQMSIFMDSNHGGEKIDTLKAAGLGALGGLLGAISGDRYDSETGRRETGLGDKIGDIQFAEEILVPAGAAAATAALGGDMNFDIGRNLCPNYSVPNYNLNRAQYNNPYNRGAWGLFDEGTNYQSGIFNARNLSGLFR